MQTEKYLRELFGVDRDTISKWRYEFSEYLSPSATQKGETRNYTEADIRVFALIFEHWEENPDYENIRMMLNSGEQDNDHYFELVYLSTPVFKEILPNDIEEPVNYGLILDSRAMQEPILVPRAYKYAGDTLVNTVLSHLDSPWELAYPIFYMYRHTIELYLKIIVDYKYDPNDREAHSLSRFVKELKQIYQKDINPWAEDFLDKFAEIDRSSAVFRYWAGMPDHIIEWWVDLRHLSTAMDFLCREFEQLIRDKERRSI